MEYIHLFELSNSEKDYIEDIINEWIVLNRDMGDYELVKIDNLDNLDEVNILLFNVNIKDTYIEQVKNIMEKIPSINICFFVLPKDISSIKQLNELNDENPNANIGTILKPTQYSKTNEFMNSVIHRIKPLEFEDDSQFFDITEFM